MAKGRPKISDSKSENNNKITSEIPLKELKDLGGVEDDLKLIEDVVDDEEEILCKDELDVQDDTLSKAELLQFVKGLCFNKIEQKLIIVKDNVAELEPSSEGQKTSDEDPQTKTKGKKSKKVDDEVELPNIETLDDVKTTETTLPNKVRGNKYKRFDDDGLEIESAEPVKEIVKALPAGRISQWGNRPPDPHKVRNYMLVKPNKKWFENELVVELASGSSNPGNQVNILEFENYAKQLHQNEVVLYKKHQSTARNRSNFHWIETVLRSGTTADKMAAYVVLIQDSPVHNLATLESLIKMVDVKGKKECLMAVDTLKDLFSSDLLLENGKLRPFEQQPIGSLDQLANGNRDSYDKLLLLWYFESALKRRYNQFLTALGKMAHDTLESTKHKAINTMFTLLTSNAEQEQILLKNVVNKVGDPHQKVAAQSSSLLSRLTDVHPNMKSVVVAEVERLLFRPNVSARASYYAVCFLNQLILDHQEKVLAAKLISIYFALFKAAIKKGEVNSKMMSALLTGVNRAFPYAKLDTSTLENEINTTYKIIHTTGFNVGIQALMLVYHVLEAGDDFSDRFYCVLYRKLLDPELKHSSKQAMFLNLLYKSLKKDQINHRVYAFVKRIFQIAPEQSPGMICALLFLVSEVLKSNSRQLLLQNTEVDSDEEEEKFEDISEDDNEHGAPEALETESHSGTVNSAATSWVHRSNLSCMTASNKDNLPEGSKTYNPLHRNPLYTGVGRTCAWELIELAQHYHPSVALFAKTLLEGNHVTYSGDPLQDFTLPRFLDRFVYRNPKKMPSSAGNNSSQRAILGKRKQYIPTGAKAHAINSKNYLHRPETSIPIDERFFHKYFVNNKEARDKQTLAKDDDADSIASDEFDMLLDNVEPGALKDEYDLDFASEVKAGSSQTKEKRGKNQADDEDDDEEDEEMDFGEDDEFEDAFKDYDEDIMESKEGIEGEFEDEYDDFEEDNSGLSDLDEMDDGFKDGIKRRKRDELSDDEESVELPEFPRKPKRSKEIDPSKLFASAEEFSALLDENATTQENTTGLEAMANRDNAHIKQLNWEQERDRWVRGVDWKSKMKRNIGRHPAGKRSNQRFAPRAKVAKKNKSGKKK